MFYPQLSNVRFFISTNEKMQKNAFISECVNINSIFPYPPPTPLLSSFLNHPYFSVIFCHFNCCKDSKTAVISVAVKIQKLLSFQYALKRKFQSASSLNKSEHWLDPAKEKYDTKLVGDTKILLRVLVLFLPLPVFWALFDQQVIEVVTWSKSRWNNKKFKK